MKTLKQKRDELAKQWSDKPEHNKTIVQACISEADFKEGFDAGAVACDEMMRELVGAIKCVTERHKNYGDDARKSGVSLGLNHVCECALAKYEKWKAGS